MGNRGFASPAAAQEITGGPIEVGVFYEEGPWFDHAKSIGDSLEADFRAPTVKYTFANTASDSARALRWQNGDPLDVDTGRWSNQAPPTWDWVDNGFVLDMSAHVDQPLASGEKWADTFTAGSQVVRHRQPGGHDDAGRLVGRPVGNGPDAGPLQRRHLRGDGRAAGRRPGPSS